ncbi:MAG: hypothetical protein HQQ73_08900 [Desulfobulbaceae bacterium]|nr:hypothetical protein [Desulfobulbaceae bacterium]
MTALYCIFQYIKEETHETAHHPPDPSCRLHPLCSLRLCHRKRQRSGKHDAAFNPGPGKKAKTGFFPHAEHQERLHCSECHHSKGADGKQVPYVEGQTIAKCESCHNSKAEDMSTDYNTFQKVGHARCRECHRQTDASLVKCSVCHTGD